MITQLINPQVNHAGESSIVTMVLPGQALAIGRHHCVTLTVPCSLNRPGFYSRDDFEFDVQLSNPNSEQRFVMRKGDRLDMSASAAVVLWPVAVTYDADTHRVHSLALKLVATDERVQWAVRGAN